MRIAMSAISPLLSESKCSGRVYQVNISLEALILKKLNVKKTRHCVTLHVASTPGCQLEGHPGHPCLLLKHLHLRNQRGRLSELGCRTTCSTQEKRLCNTQGRSIWQELMTCSYMFYTLVLTFYTLQYDIREFETLQNISPSGALLHCDGRVPHWFTSNETITSSCVLFACHLLLSSTIHPHSKKILAESKAQSLLRGTALGPTASGVGRIRTGTVKLKQEWTTLKNMQKD